MTDRELLQQALDALEKISMGGSPDWADDVIPVIHTRLAQDDIALEDGFIPVQGYWGKHFVEIQHPTKPNEIVRFKFDAQPEKEWVGLTDEEIYFEMPYKDTLFEFARSIEAKLKEKNSG
jgi:hypothetical protein